MNDRPLFRNGKVVTKIRTMPDGSLLLFKPFIVKPEHIMRLTDAPGWDKEHVDATFTDDIPGGLRYTQDIVQYDISIEDFRVHAFVKNTPGFGDQYHVHRKYYRSTGLRTVSPKRGGDAPETPVVPKKITFGEWVPCTKCGMTGGSKKERCTKCQGTGVLRWTSSSATS